MENTMIDVDRLQRDLQAERSKVQVWAEDRVSSAREISDDHFKAVGERAGVLEDLEQQRAELHQRAIELQGRMAEEAAFVQELQERLNEARGTEGALPDQIDKLQEKLQHEFNRVQEREAALAADNARSLEQLEQLQSQVDRFRTNLGLKLQRPDAADGQLTWIFTQIDEADPAKEFSFGMSVNEGVVGGHRYQVGNCQPAVPELQEYSNQLNETGNLSLFVRRMRRAFKTLTTAEGVAQLNIT